MDLQEFYYACEGNYQDVKARLIKEELIQRLVIKFLDDDTYEKLMVRLESYREETKPVIDYYRQKGIVYDVDAGQTIDDVYKQIESILKNVAEEETK